MGTPDEPSSISDFALLWFWSIKKQLSSHSGADKTYTGYKQQQKGELKNIAFL